jgi:hypothetical protein
LRDFRRECGGPEFQRRSHGQAGAHGIIDFVRHTRHQSPKRCEFFRLDQEVLGLLQI